MEFPVYLTQGDTLFYKLISQYEVIIVSTGNLDELGEIKHKKHRETPVPQYRNAGHLLQIDSQDFQKVFNKVFTKIYHKV